MNILHFIKRFALPFSMLIGGALYPFAKWVNPLTPALIFAMLLLTFSKMKLSDLKIKPVHYWLIAIQVIASLLLYGIIRPFNETIAQGILICVMVSPATASPVITGMLGGSVSTLTTYILLCNVVVSLYAPLLFSFMGMGMGLPFHLSFLNIFEQIGTLLLLPLLASWAIRRFIPVVHQKIVSISQLSFYLWAFALAIVTGMTVSFLIEHGISNILLEIGLFAASMVICLLHFVIGRKIGRKYGDPVSGGQALGQKNTILAIWMAQSYMNPLASVAPAAYVLWQNVVNSYQLYLREKGKALPF